MNYFKGVVLLTESQYNELKLNGRITINDVEYFFNDNYLYVTPTTFKSTILDIAAPTKESIGEIGQLYLDTIAQKLYVCVAINRDDELDTIEYIWNEVGGGGSVDIDEIENHIKNDSKTLSLNYTTEYYVKDDDGVISTNSNLLSRGSITYKPFDSDVSLTPYLTTTRTTKTIIEAHNIIVDKIKNCLTLDTAQTITGAKTFTENIYLANADGTVDRISHINNNFIIYSGLANGIALLNIDEGLNKIYAFNKELAFKEDIISSSGGTTVYVAGVAKDSISVGADIQTQLDAIASSVDGKADRAVVDQNTIDINSLETLVGTNITDIGNLRTSLNNYLPLSGGVLSGPLKITGGDGTSAGKIKLDNENRGQITDLNTATIFGFNNATTITVGAQGYILQTRGKETRPTYNGTEMVLFSDLSGYLPKTGGTMEGDIKLPTGKFIVDSSGYGLVGYSGEGSATFGNGNRGINLRGNTTRPLYNSNEIAMMSDIHAWNIPSTPLEYTGYSKTTHTIDISSLTGDTSGNKIYEVIWANESYCDTTAFLTQFSDVIADYGLSNQRFSTNGRQGGEICTMLVKRYLYYIIAQNNLAECYNKIVAWREVR